MKQNYLKANYSERSQNKSYDLQLVTYLLGHMNPMPKGGEVLDLACGTGGFASTFQQLGFRYTGVDIDNHKPAENIFRADIGNEGLPFDGNRFDIVFFKMAIEHLNLAEIAHCLQEVRRVLKPGGGVIILTPDWHWMYQLFYTEFTHQTPFTPSSLRTAVEMNNLVCTESKTVIQLPFVWKIPALKIVCDIIHVLYPVMRRWKVVRYSKERIVFALGMKPVE